MSSKYIKFNSAGHNLHYCPQSISIHRCISRNTASYKPPEYHNRVNTPINTHKHVRKLAITITHKCNMSCCYCYDSGNKTIGLQAHDDIDINILTDLIERVSNEATDINIHFIGGEPYLSKYLIEDCVKYCGDISNSRHVTFSFSVSTNGTLITQQDALFAKEHNIKVKISMSGSHSYQNKYRPMTDGTDSFERILLTLNYLQSYDCNYHVILIIHPDSIKAMPDFFNTIYPFKPTKVHFSPLLVGTNDPLFKNNYNERLYERSLLTIARQLIDNKDFSGLMKIHNYASYIPYIHNKCRKPTGCSAKNAASMAIDMDGCVYPCSTFIGNKQFRLGHFKDIPFKISSHSCPHVKTCKSCWAYELCGGGCLFDNHAHKECVSSRINRCKLTKAEIMASLKIYSELYPHNIM